METEKIFYFRSLLSGLKFGAACKLLNEIGLLGFYELNDLILIRGF